MVAQPTRINDRHDPKVRMPETDAGLIDLVKMLVPADTDPEKILTAVEKLARYKGYTIKKAVVKDAIADALDTFVCKIDWPLGWRKVDWFVRSRSIRSSPW